MGGRYTARRLCSLPLSKVIESIEGTAVRRRRGRIDLEAGRSASEQILRSACRGFGTLGLARTTSDEVEFVRDLSQPSGIRKDWDGRVDSVLGLQAAWQISPAFCRGAGHGQVSP